MHSTWIQPSSRVYLHSPVNKLETTIIKLESNSDSPIIISRCRLDQMNWFEFSQISQKFLDNLPQTQLLIIEVNHIWRRFTLDRLNCRILVIGTDLNSTSEFIQTVQFISGKDSSQSISPLDMTIYLGQIGYSRSLESQYPKMDKIICPHGLSNMGGNPSNSEDNPSSAQITSKIVKLNEYMRKNGICPVVGKHPDQITVDSVISDPNLINSSKVILFDPIKLRPRCSEMVYLLSESDFDEYQLERESQFQIRTILNILKSGKLDQPVHIYRRAFNNPRLTMFDLQANLTPFTKEVI